MKLLDHRDQVLSSVAGSTAAIDFPELLPFVAHALDVAVIRREAADKARAARSTALRAGIRLAAATVSEAMPLGLALTARRVQRRIELKGPEAFGLRRVPDIDTVRDVLNEMRVSFQNPT